MATNKPTQTLITDTFSQLVDDVNTISLDLGATGRLNTNEDSSAVAAINELEVAVRGTSNNLVATDLTSGGLTATDLTAAVVELDSDIGARPHTTLTTLAKTLTGAINELHDSLGDATLTTLNKEVKEAINELHDSIGDAALTTSAGEVKEAINELDAELGTITAGAMGTTASTVGGAIAELEAEIDTLNTYVEPTQSLNTDATTVGDAINELHDSIGSGGISTTAQTLVGGISELDSDIGARPHTTLNTTAKTLTGAVNELFADIAIDSNGNNDNLVADNIFGSFEKLDSAVGSLSFDADIADKTDLTTAINSLSQDLASLDSSSGLNTNTIGSLRLLDSDGFVGDERLKVVNALNALRADIPKIFNESGTQLN